MKLDNALTKKIIMVIAATIFMLWIALNYNVALDILSYVIGLLLPLIYGVCIAFILNVLMKFFENRLLSNVTKHIKIDSRGGRFWSKTLRPLSLILTFLAVAGLVYFVTAMIIPSLKETIQLLIKQAPYFTNLVRDWFNSLLAHFNLDLTIDSIAQIRDIINSYDENLFENIVEFLSGTGSTFALGIAGFAADVFSTVTNSVFGLIFAIYILVTKEKLGRQSKKFIIAVFNEKKSKKILDIAKLSQHIFERFVAGQCIEAVVIGTLTCLGSLLINPEFAVMLGVLVGFTALIPVVGAIIGVVVGALLLVMISPWQALAFIVFILILQQLENNLIYPKVVGKSIGLPGMWVFFAVLAGGSVYGIMGIIIGVPLVSVIYSLLRIWTNRKLIEKKHVDLISLDIAKEHLSDVLEAQDIDIGKIEEDSETKSSENIGKKNTKNFAKKATEKVAKEPTEKTAKKPDKKDSDKKGSSKEPPQKNK